MAKYVKVGTTGGLEEEATLGTSAGNGSADKIPHLDSQGKLDVSFLPTGIGADTAGIQASEALAAGDYVNIHDVTSSARVRKADASDPNKRAHGFVIAAVSSGANATVYFEGANANQSGLTIGGTVFLSSTTPGKGTTTMPTATAGHILQVLGVAIAATTVNTELEDPIKRA